MSIKPKHQRLVFVAFTVVFLCIAVVLVLRAFRENLVFFYSPAELVEHHIDASQLIRLGGLVENGSVVRDGDNITFRVTDGKANITISYHGMLPNLFREGQGVVAEGHLTDPQHFAADTILAKHDENYMPKEVVDALKKSGHWKGAP